MSEYATAVHGLTLERLERKSKGLRFEAYSRELTDLFAGKRIAGHSVGCDLRALRQEFKRCGVEFPEHKQFCTMNHFTPILNIHIQGQRKPKSPSLAEVCESLGVKREDVLRACGELYDCSSAPHDARYDACATLLCIERGFRRGLIRGILPEGW